MQRRFSVYMDMLESRGLGEMKRATKNNFSYKIQEQGKFLTRKQAEAEGAYRDPNFGKASGTTVTPPEANQVKPTTTSQQAEPVQPEVTADDIRAFDNTLSPEESDAINNEPHRGDNDKSILDPHGKKTDAIIQSRQPAPAQPAPAQPGKMDRFLSGVNKAGEKIGNFQDRAKAFSQRTGGQGTRGDLSKLMKYGMFGQESLDKPAQINNLKQQFIQQGYSEDEAQEMATNTVNQVSVDNQKQQDKQAGGVTTKDQEGVATTNDQQTGVQTSTPTQTGVQTNIPTKTTDTLDQATFDTIDPDDMYNLKTIPDDQLAGAIQAVADGNNVDAVALRKHIDAQRQAISNTQQ